MMVRPKIVVIDDEPGPRESLKMILKDRYQVYLAEGPLEGLELVETHRPDLVFLDIKMPQMDGIEVLGRIKEIALDIEVAMITAYAAVESAQQALRLGAIDYLIKPFGVNEVTWVVDRALRTRRERTEEQLLLEQLQQATEVLSQQLRQFSAESDSADHSTVVEGLASVHTSIGNQLDNVGRLTAIGEIAAEVAHDVDNFLSAILLRIEILLMNLRHSQQLDVGLVEDGLKDIVQAARDSAQAVDRIATLSKADPYQPIQPVQVNDILHRAIDLSASQSADDEAARIIWDVQQIPEITGNPAALRTAFMNILINARQAISDGGEIRLCTYAEDDSIVAEITDSGVGMPSEIIERITEPFFTTKRESGSGLGLSITRKIIDRHAGALTFDSQPGQGTTVRVTLPLAGKEAPAGVGNADVPDVLVVDDDDRQLALIDAFLTAAGLKIDTVNNGPGGLSRFQEYLHNNDETPPVVVTDLRMPDLDGAELARQVKHIASQTRVILLSGYITDEAEVSSAEYVDAVMRKPFEFRQLLEQITGAPERPDA